MAGLRPNPYNQRVESWSIGEFCRSQRLKLADRSRSLVIGAGIESVLVGVIYWLHRLLNLRPLPIHPVSLLSFLSQLPGALAAIPFVIVEQSASEQMADRLE